ncbi:MAG: N-acetylglutamate synthase, CG3035 family [Actinomycetota bacterium]
MLRSTDVGRRVVVRYRLREPADGARATDVLGVLMSWSGGTLVVRTKTGALVSVDEGDVLAAKVVPPQTLTRRQIRDLEAAAAQGWRALESDQLGGWLLRAAGGFTGRANSCLPLSDPGMPLGAAVDRVEQWYRERGLPPMFQVPDRLGGQLDRVLDARGWFPATEDVLVMTAELPSVAAAMRDDLPPVTVAPAPDDAWLARYHYRGGALPPHARDVLVNAALVGFGAVDEAGEPIAIARGAVSDAPSGRRWLGVTAVEVDPSQRRRGLGTHIVAGVARWAGSHGATDVYLQVSDGNSAALAAYERMGFTEHHRYRYRALPLIT